MLNSQLSLWTVSSGFVITRLVESHSQVAYRDGIRLLVHLNDRLRWRCVWSWKKARTFFYGRWKVRTPFACCSNCNTDTCILGTLNFRSHEATPDAKYNTMLSRQITYPCTPNIWEIAEACHHHCIYDPFKCLHLPFKF